MASQPLESHPFAGLDDVKSWSELRGEPQPLGEFRQRAARVAQAMPLPDRSRHLWRFTDPSRFVPQLDPLASAPQPAPEAWQWEDGVTAAVLLARDEVTTLYLSSEAASRGVKIVPLSEPNVVGLLGSAVPPEHGFLEALNATAFRPGLAVVVPPKLRMEQPIRLRLEAAAKLFLPRLLIIVGEEAEVEILEGHVGGQEGHQVLSVTEVHVGPGAVLRYDLVQRWELGVTGHLTSRVVLAEGAKARLALASFGGSVTKVDTGAILAGVGADVETYGVCLGFADQHFDHHTEHLHVAAFTHSNLDFKVALAGKARSAYSGLIRIEEHATSCEAYQENRNLLLSEQTRAHSIPELEILNEDVRCTHGATVAPLDEEQVFYLKSRGLPHYQAVRLIVYGFLDQTLSRLPKATRERIEALVAGRLHGEVL